MDVCGWRLLRAGPSTLTQHKVQLSLMFQVLWWQQNLQPTGSILALHLMITRVTKAFGTEQQPLCHSYKLFSCISPLLQVGISFTPHRCVPMVPRAYLQISTRGSDCWWTNSLPSTISLLLITRSLLETGCDSVTSPVLSLRSSSSSAMICLIRQARQFRRCTHSCPCYTPAEAN